MRILVVSHTYVTAENRRKLEVMARSAEVLALVPQRGLDISGAQEVSGRQQRGGYELQPLPVFGSTRPGTRWLFARVREPWRRFRPDVALIEQEVWSWAFLQALVLRRAYAPQAVLVPFAWESQRRPGWKGFVSGLFYWLAIRSAAVILVGNRGTRTLFLQHGASSERLFVMPQVGLDAERLRPLEEPARQALRAAGGWSRDAFLVGFAGRLVPEKGLPDLVAAVQSLQRSARLVHLVLIGDGPLRASLLEQAARGVPLRLLPPVPREQLASFYQVLDAFVLSSRTTPLWKEQFGMVLAEAMACGVPVVGSSSGAIPDLMGGTGLVYREGDVAGLAGTLERLAADPALRAQLARRGRERSARLFSHEAVAAQTLAAIGRALGVTGEEPLVLHPRSLIGAARTCDVRPGGGGMASADGPTLDARLLRACSHPMALVVKVLMMPEPVGQSHGE